MGGNGSRQRRPGNYRSSLDPSAPPSAEFGATRPNVMGRWIRRLGRRPLPSSPLAGQLNSEEPRPSSRSASLVRAFLREAEDRTASEAPPPPSPLIRQHASDALLRNLSLPGLERASLSPDGSAAPSGAATPNPDFPAALLSQVTAMNGRLQPGIHIFQAGAPGVQSNMLVVLFVRPTQSASDASSENGEVDTAETGASWIMYVITTNGEMLPQGDSYEALLALQERLGLVSRGASAEMVGTLPTSIFQKGLALPHELACCICLQDYQDGDDIRKLPCEHGFHCECVDRWLTETVNTCPLCRMEAVPRSSPMQQA